MNRKINREAYLAYARMFSEQEKVLVKEFQSWLPDVIIDCHAHCGLPEHVLSINERAFNHMFSTFPSFSLTESKEWHSLLHPNKKIRSLRFPKAFKGIDHRATNLYLLEQSDPQDRVALYGLPDDPEYTIKMLQNPRVSALKMYYSYFEPPATKIYQYFPKVILEEAQRKGIPIILHPPRQIAMCLDQILFLTRDFPDLWVCLAHLSLTKSVVPGLKEAFSTIVKFPRVHFDTALMPSSEVMEMALRIIGPDRIMYGSDEPLHLIRSVPFLHPEKGERLATDFPYHWVDPIDYQKYRKLTVGVTHAHWQALLAIKKAVSALPKKEQESVKQKLFHNNAKEFYGF
jgi:uncharacterized protein